MSVYREGYKGVEEITKASKRIYPDAADYGAPTKKGDKLWNWAKQIVTDYGIEGTRKELLYEGIIDHNVSQQIELVDEWAYSDDESPNRSAEKYTQKFLIEYNVCTKGECKGYDGFLTVTKL